MTNELPERLRDVELFAWVGEDELGSGQIGIKQGLVPAGLIPIVATSRKVARPDIAAQMHGQAQTSGKRIYLVRFTATEVVMETITGTPL
jgi:hypothetical protein